MKSDSPPPGILLVLNILLTGFAVFIGIAAWFRQLILLFGGHMVSIGIISTALMLNVARGSRMFGKRADRHYNPARLLFFLQIGLVLYSMCLPLINLIMSALSGYFVHRSNTGLFGISIYRFILSFLFFVPAALAGGLIPVYSKIMIRHMSQIGRKTGVIFAFLSLGAIAGCCLGNFYAINKLGFPATQYIAAFILLLISVITFLLIRNSTGILPTFHHPLAQKARLSGQLLLKRNPVLETEIKLTRTLLWIFTIQGFTTMAYMIVWTRTLNSFPVLNAGIVIPGMTIVMLTGVAIGSLFFNGFINRPVKKFHVLGLINMFIGASAALSYILLYIFWNRILNGAGNSPDHSSFRYLFLIAVFVLLPTVLTGATLPMACKLYPKRFRKTGQRIGYLGSLFIMGAILSLLMTSFIFVPLTGIYIVFFITITVSILTGLFLFLRDSRFKRLFRVALFFIAAASLFILQSSFKNRTYITHLPSMYQTDSIATIKEGSTGTIMLLPQPGKSGNLYLNGNLLLSTDEQGMKVQQLLAYLPCMFSMEYDSSYLSGFGLGVTASSLEKCGVNTIMISETSPEIIALTSSAFASMNNDILTDQTVSINIEDCRSFLYRTGRNIDMITFSYEYPWLKPDDYSKQFYQLCAKKLKDGGIFCQILPAFNIDINIFKAILKTSVSVFPDVSLWYTGSARLILMATVNENAWDYCRLRDKFTFLNRDNKFTEMNIPSLEALLGNILLDDTAIRMITDSTQIITDNHPLWGLHSNAGNPLYIDPQIVQLFNNAQIEYDNFLNLSVSCDISPPHILNILNSYRKITLAEIDISD